MSPALRRWTILVAVLSFVASFIAGAPAALLYAGFKPEGASLTLQGVDGTLRRGELAAVQVNGQTVIERLHWQWRLRDLLLARLGVELDSSAAAPLQAHVSRSLTSLRVDELRFDGMLKPLLAAVGQPYAPVDARLSLDVPQLRLQHDWPVDATGSVEVRQLSWTLARDPIVLGSFAASVQRDGDDLIALIRTLDGPLDVNGDARAKPDRSYELHLQLKPKADAPPLLSSFLQSLGAPDSQGYYSLRRTGRMPGGATPAAAR